MNINIAAMPTHAHPKPIGMGGDGHGCGHPMSGSASHYAWGTKCVCECKMDVRSTWIPIWHQMDHVSWSFELFSHTTSWRYRPNYECGCIIAILYPWYYTIVLYNTPKVEPWPNAFIVAHELGWASTRSRPGPPSCSIRNNSIVKSLWQGYKVLQVAAATLPW